MNSDGNTVQGCYIGTNSAGTADQGNGDAGVLVPGGRDNNLIGGTTSAARNIISGNSTGVRIDIGSVGNLVRGNFIGTDVTGTVDLGNTQSGVLVSNAQNNTIGGTVAGARNVISGNNFGVTLLDNLTTGNLVQGNYIGTDVNGTADLGNGNGVLIDLSANNNTIGGTVAAARNVISGNGDGVQIQRSSSDNLVQGNFIGTDVNGTADLGNSGTGVFLEGGVSGNTIGGIVAGGNVISGNNVGVRMQVSVFVTPTNNLVAGNFIGTDSSGTAALGNNLEGVRIEAGADNTIGACCSEPIPSPLMAAMGC